MPYITELLKTIILLGAVNGLVLSILLFCFRRQQISNRLLACLIGLISMACLNIHWLEAEWLGATRWLSFIADVLPLVIIMPVGPLLWLYTQSVLDPAFRVTTKHHRHFYPVLIDLLPSLVMLVTDISMMTDNMSKPTRLWVSDALDLYYIYEDVPRWISLAIYLRLTWQYFRQRAGQTLIPEQATIRGKAALPGQGSNKEYPVIHQQVDWIRQLLQMFTGFLIVWLLHLIPYAIPATSRKLLEAVGWYPVFIPMAVLVYWAGIKGYLMAYHAARSVSSNLPATGNNVPSANTLSANIPSTVISSADTLPANTLLANTSLTNTPSADPLLTQSSLSLPEATITKVIALLTEAMSRDKLYLQSDLTVNILAQYICVPPKTVSAVLNQHLDKSFSAFINEYRVEAFKEKLQEEAAQQLTIIGIARDCGFSSTATFQRIFKQLTGMSPTQYQQQAGNTSRSL